MMRRRTLPAPLPQYRRIPLTPSFWDRPDFGEHVMESTTGSWVRGAHGEEVER